MKKWRVIGLLGACAFIFGISLEFSKVNGLVLREWWGLSQIISFSLTMSGFVAMVVGVIRYSLIIIKNKK